MEHLTSLRNKKGKRAAICLLLLLSLLIVVPCAAARAGEVYRSVQTDRRVIALTFDDGPHPIRTPAILGILEEFGVRATFFMIGENIDYYRSAAEQVVKAGHEIGNHTDTHPNLSRTDEKTLEGELLRAEEKIRSLTGETPLVFRPPEGSCPSGLSTLAARRGYSVILWTVDTRDWAGVSARKIEQTVMQNVREGAILLFHDYTSKTSHTVEALRRIIPLLIEKGYGFVTVSELLALENEK